MSRELSVTNRTSRQILAGVSSGVLLQVRGRRKLFIARDARELLAGVFHHVRLQLGSVIANFVAHCTFVRLFARVLPHMNG
jgi:hypothetical protein